MRYTGFELQQARTELEYWLRVRREKVGLGIHAETSWEKIDQEIKIVETIIENLEREMRYHPNTEQKTKI